MKNFLKKVFAPQQEDEKTKTYVYKIPEERRLEAEEKHNITITENDPFGKFQVNSIEFMLIDAHESNQGLLPHEILVLSYAGRFKTTQKEFQGFWKYKYDVLDVNKVLKYLCANDFIMIETLDTAITHKKVTELKDILKNNNLKTTGIKKDLVKRVLTNVPNIEDFVFDYYYKLTEKGIKELSDNEYIKYIHDNPNTELDIWSLNKMLYKKNKKQYKDTLWGYFNGKILEFMKKGDWGAYRSVRLQMAHQVISEKRWLVAFNLLIEIIYLDLRIPKYHYFYGVFQGCDNFFPYAKSTIKIAPGIMAMLSKVISNLGFDDKKLRELFIEKFEKYNYIHTERLLFNHKELAVITLAEINKNTAILDDIYDSVKQRFFEINCPHCDKNTNCNVKNNISQPRI